MKQLTKDVYDEYQRARKSQRTGNKRRVELAASALAGAADEPASDGDDLPTEMPARAVAAAQGDGVRLRSTEAAESIARSLVASHSRMEIA